MSFCFTEKGGLALRQIQETVGHYAQDFTASRLLRCKFQVSLSFSTIRGLKAKPHRGMQLVSEQSPIGRMNIQYTHIFFECALIVLIAPIYSDSFQSEVHMLATGHTRHSSTDIFPPSNLANVDPWYQAN